MAEIATREILSNEEYIDEGGAVCPVCGSNELEGETLDGGGDEAWQQIRCLSCNAIWNDLYKLTGFELVDEGDNYVAG